MMRSSRNTARSARRFAGVASILLLVLAARGLFGRNVSGVRAQTGDPARTVFYTRQLADGATQDAAGAPAGAIFVAAANRGQVFSGRLQTETN